jgi:hypothetical protein
MVGDNDAGAFATYTQAGQDSGTTLLRTLMLLIPVLYVSLGAVTGVGHARLILERFGPAKAAAREGKVQLSGYIPVDFKRRLDIHAAREGITIQSIVEEMHDLYAAAHGLTRLGGRREYGG